MTTMTQDIGAMIEARNAREWEELNMPNADGAVLTLAARSLKYAVEDLDKTLDLINEAAEILVDTPEGDRVASYMNEMENMLTDLKIMQAEYERRGN